MNRQKNRSCQGSSSILAVFFVSLFTVLAISFTGMTNVNLQMSKNHSDLSAAQAASESGLEYAKALLGSYVPPAEASTAQNSVSETEGLETFGFFYDHVFSLLDGSAILNGKGIAYDNVNGTMRLPATGGIQVMSNSSSRFFLDFTFVPATGPTENHLLYITSTGTSDGIERRTRLSFPIEKDAEVLEYAIASRGRIWVTGDTTIEGDIFSDYDNLQRAPFNTTAETTVNGTLNVVITQDEALNASLWQMEKLERMVDENGDWILDGYGDPVYGPVFDENGDRVYDLENDQVLGYHEGINYDQYSDVPGMDISDYDTDGYNNGLTDIPPSSTIETEYFPHKSGGYAEAKYSWSSKLPRHVYTNMNFTNVRLPDENGRVAALFVNCTFNEVLYIDVNKSGNSKYNNVRFENCTFNGTIVTDTPQQLKWRENALYFTGTATFQNNSYEATILAPNFNVDLGNTNPNQGESNQLNGAVIGGIVDVRGNAVVNGTIISMADTSQYTGGFVTNVGATLGDGGSETTNPGDVGTIVMTPKPDARLPSGIITPIVIGQADANSYVEL